MVELGHLLIACIAIHFQPITGQKFTKLAVVTPVKLLHPKAVESLRTISHLAKVELHVAATLDPSIASDDSAAILYMNKSCSSVTSSKSRLRMMFPLEMECGEYVPADVIMFPGYDVLDRLRWPCLFSTLTRLLTYGKSVTSDTRSHRRGDGGDGNGYFNATLVPRLLNPTHEYRSCGTWPENVPRIMPAMMTKTEQLQMGRRFLKGRHLVIATLHRRPFVLLTMNNSDIVACSGFFGEIINTLSYKYNFSFNMVLPYDGNWGTPMKNGTFNGMVGMVMREWVDMGMGSFTYTHVRAEVISFTDPFYEEPTAILLPAPQEKTNPAAFLEPFTYKVWLTMICSAALVGPIVWMLTEKVGDWAAIFYPYRRKKGALSEYIWEAAYSLIGQGDPSLRLNGSSRTLLGTYYLYCIIMNYTYTSTLISFLTVPRLTKIISGVEELANQREILWTYLANTAHEKLFEEATPPSTYYKIGQLAKERNLRAATNAEGINNVLYKKMAFIKEKSFLDSAMEDDFLSTGQCRLAQAPQVFFSAPFGWILEKHSVYHTLFNVEIARMKQSGLLAAWLRKYFPKPNKCAAIISGKDTSVRALRVEDLSGHWVLLALGSAIATTVFILEHVVARCEKKS